MVRKLFIHLLLMAFVLTNGMRPVYAQQAVTLPVPGTRLDLSPVFAPPLLKGIKVYRNDPFRFDFILDKGDSQETDEQLKTDSNRLIKYFLASLTVPEKDLWVNLSPYEKDRIVPEAFGQTEMGRDLLAQDYILKQITASVIYPESKVGKEFWKKVYADAQKQYGTTDIPVDTFNKVWIIPEKATVYENKDAAFVIESKLKVMLEEDYLALEKNSPIEKQSATATNKLGSDIVREVVIPILEKEVNEGKNFAPLCQVYHSLILATWYKRKVKASILGQAYVDRKKIAGVDIANKNDKEKIWSQYVEAYKKGAYNLIKEEYDPVTQTTLPRKYFSGGTDLAMGDRFKARQGVKLPAMTVERSRILQVKTVDSAMTKDEVDEQTAADLSSLRTYFPGALGQFGNQADAKTWLQETFLKQSKRLSGERVAVMGKAANKTFIVGGLDRTLVDNFNLPFMAVAGIFELPTGETVLPVRAPHKRQGLFPTLPGGYGQFDQTPEENVLAEMRDELRLKTELDPHRLELVKVVSADRPEITFFYRYRATEEESQAIRAVATENERELQTLTKDEYFNQLNLLSQMQPGQGETAGFHFARLDNMNPESTVNLSFTFNDGEVLREQKGLAVPLRLFIECTKTHQYDLNFIRTTSENSTMLGAPEEKYLNNNKHLSENVTVINLAHEDKILSAQQRDHAMSKSQNSKIGELDLTQKGGIDFNPDKLDIKAQEDGLTFAVDTALLQRIQNAPGISPVIIGIRQLESLSAFLGVQEPALK